MRASRSKKDVEPAEADELDRARRARGRGRRRSRTTSRAEPRARSSSPTLTASPRRSGRAEGRAGGGAARSRPRPLRPPAETASRPADEAGTAVPRRGSTSRRAISPRRRSGRTGDRRTGGDCGAEPETEAPRTERSARTDSRSASARDVGRAAARNDASRRRGDGTRLRRRTKVRRRGTRRLDDGASGVRSDVRVDRRLRLAFPRVAAIMRRPCGPPARHDLTK